MHDVLQALLSDPLTAKESLERDRTAWLPLLELTRQQALDTLLSDGSWLSSKPGLDSYAAPGDKLDEQNQLQLFYHKPRN